MAERPPYEVGCCAASTGQEVLAAYEHQYGRLK
jgi:hypothetical protein